MDSAGSNHVGVAQGEYVTGHRIWGASIINRRHSNDDRYAIVSLEDVPSSQLPKLACYGFKAAENAARAVPGETNTGGCTGTAGIYDPERLRLYLRSRGDSHAYIVLHDDADAVAIRVTSPLDGYGNIVTNILPPDASIPYHRAIYSFEQDSEDMSFPTERAINKEEERHMIPRVCAARKRLYAQNREQDFIDIAGLIAEGARAFGLDPDRTQATLVAGSDALEKGFPVKHALKNHFFARKIASLASGEDENPAMALARQIEGAQRTGDNATAIILPLRLDREHRVFGIPAPRGHGKPLAFMIADGFYTHGGAYAQAAVDGFTARMRQEQDKFHADRVTRAQEKEAHFSEGSWNALTAGSHSPPAGSFRR